jgi:hypothetical protein
MRTTEDTPDALAELLAHLDRGDVAATTAQLLACSARRAAALGPGGTARVRGRA